MHGRHAAGFRRAIIQKDARRQQALRVPQNIVGNFRATDLNAAQRRDRAALCPLHLNKAGQLLRRHDHVGNVVKHREIQRLIRLRRKGRESPVAQRVKHRAYAPGGGEAHE